jgi:plastocyanin
MSLISRRICWKPLVFTSLLGLACSPALAEQKAPAPDPYKPAPSAGTPYAKPSAPTTPAPGAGLDPAKERAQAFREAASLLEKAADALARGNKSFAEQLFSSAELLVGADALAELAGRFRAGAPPLLATPLKTVPDAGKQPAVVGSSDADSPDAKPEKGSLAGTMQIDGKVGGGFGVVTLEPLGKKFKKREPKQRVIEQRNREFLPHVLAVPVGSTVSFPNYDPTFHNVFSTSESRAFDLGLYKGGQARDVVFDKEGVVRLGCNLHANMAAFVVVVAAPHYAITDDKGSFKFASLAPGKYKLRAWNERSQKPVEQEVVVKAGANSVELGVTADAPAGPAPDKFGVPRGKK